MSPGSRKLPVDRLPEATWDRIREEVFAELGTHGLERAPERPATRRWHALAVALSCAVAAVAIAIAVARPGPQPAAVTTSRWVTTDRLARTTLGDATLEASPGSELVATGSVPAGWTVVLERGSVAFSVPTRGDRPPFRVQAGAVAVQVVGTRFTVSRSGASVRVAVVEGTVRVTAPGETLMLTEDHAWSSPPEPREIETATPAPSPPPDATEPRKTSPVPSRRERFEAAAQLESKNPRQAIEGYLALSKGNDAWGANALYGAARLELELGRPVQARALLTQYLHRFPKGQNARDARALLDRMK